MKAGLAPPLDGSATLRADPPFLLLLKPGIQTYVPLALDVFQCLGVVTHAIVVEIGDLLAGKVLTLGAVGNVSGQGAGPKVTLVAPGGNHVALAALTAEFASRDILCLGDLIQQPGIVVFNGTEDEAGTAVESTGCS